MTYLRPDLLPFVPVAALLAAVAVLAHWRRAVRLVEAYGGSSAAARLTGRRLGRFPATRLILSILATVALTTAAAGPEPRQDEPPPPPTPVDLIIAVDVSQSMTGDDVDGGRIGRARQLVEEIADQAVVDRISLSIFADWPYGLVPLTADERVIDFFAPWVSPGLLAARDQGTSLGDLVGHARATWEARARSSSLPVILIVSDGEAHESGAEALDSVAAVARSGLQVWTAGVGSPSGAPLFVSGSGGAPLLDNRGAPVIAGYDPELLRQMAEEGDGRFHDISDDGGIRALIADLRTLSGTVAVDAPEQADPTTWLLLFALLALVADALLDAGGRRRASREALR